MQLSDDWVVVQAPAKSKFELVNLNDPGPAQRDHRSLRRKKKVPRAVTPAKEEQKSGNDIERVLDQVRKSLARSKRVLEGQVTNADNAIDTSLLEDKRDRPKKNPRKRKSKQSEKKAQSGKKQTNHQSDQYSDAKLETLLSSVESLLKG